MVKFWSSEESESPLRAVALQKEGRLCQAGNRSVLSYISCGCGSNKELITSRDSLLMMPDKDN